MTEEIKTDGTLTSEQFEEIVNTLSENKPEETINMENSVSKERVKQFIEEEGEDPYQAEMRNISLTDEDFEKLLNSEQSDDIKTMAKSLFDIDIDDAEVVPSSEEDITNQIESNVKSAFDDLPEEEMLQFLEVIREYRKGKTTGTFARLPETIKNFIIKNMGDEGIVDPRAYNMFANEFIKSICEEGEQDQAFIDIEKSLDEALKLPSLGDMYAEHTEKVMNEEIPRIIETIKDTEPENAEKLRKIHEMFEKSYSLEELKTHYEENARTRKLMRRDWKNVSKFAEEFNLRNSHSNFKMPDAKGAGSALYNVFIKPFKESEKIAEAGLEEEKTDLQKRIEDLALDDEILCKFLVLFYRSVIEKDPNNLYDAAYMYYGIRNLTMLGMINENKTPFTVELINNICDIIEFIRGKEAEFNAAQLSAGSGKKNRRKGKK